MTAIQLPDSDVTPVVVICPFCHAILDVNPDDTLSAAALWGAIAAAAHTCPEREPVAA